MIIVKFILKRLLKKALKSATAGVAAGGILGGAAAAIDPELLAMVPENLRPYILLGFAALVLLARLRKDIGGMVSEAKNGGIKPE